MKKSKGKKEKGQALTEYILLILILSFVALGLNRVYSKALTKYFEKIAKMRTDYAGYLRGACP